MGRRAWWKSLNPHGRQPLRYLQYSRPLPIPAPWSERRETLLPSTGGGKRREPGNEVASTPSPLCRSPATSNYFSFPLGVRLSGVQLHVKFGAQCIISKGKQVKLGRGCASCQEGNGLLSCIRVQIDGERNSSKNSRQRYWEGLQTLQTVFQETGKFYSSKPSQSAEVLLSRFIYIEATDENSLSCFYNVVNVQWDLYFGVPSEATQTSIVLI